MPHNPTQIQGWIIPSVTTLSSFHGYDADVELVSTVVEAARSGMDTVLWGDDTDLLGSYITRIVCLSQTGKW